MFSLLQIVAFEPGAGICLISDENTCDLLSTFLEAVLGFQV